MSWNYRVVKVNNEYGIHEIYYDNAGRIVGHSESSVIPVVDTVEELRQVLLLFQEALEKDVVEIKV